MIRTMTRSPRGLMICYAVSVNIVSGFLAALIWAPLTTYLPALTKPPVGSLFPIMVAVILAVVVSSFFCKRITTPMEQIIRATKAISQGDYSVRVPEAGEGEIRQLLCSFNKMTAELGSTELMRNDFLNTFSHEFKTPIVSIRGFARRLRQGGLCSQKEREYLDYIVSESERLAKLSSNILLLSKYENQQFISDRQDFELSEQLRRCVLRLEKQWEAKQISFDFQLPENIPYRGSEEMLDHVWLNLIENAVKFSHCGGVIHLRAACAQDAVTVTIRDEGIGMSGETLRHIFDQFYQADTAHAGAGCGLGLPLVRRIVTLCGGRIAAESREGHGAAFCVYLPLAPNGV